MVDAKFFLHCESVAPFRKYPRLSQAGADTRFILTEEEDFA